MAFKASNVVPQEAYRQVKGAAVQLKINLLSMKSQLASSGANYDFLHGIYMTLKQADDQFTSLKSTPGLVQFAKDQESDQTYDVASEFTTMQASIAAAMAWMQSNVPTSVTAKSPDQWSDSSLISNTFTPAQTTGLQLALQSVIDEIS